MKRPLLLGGTVLLVIAFAVAAACWVTWRYNLKRLRSPASVTEETGLKLPNHARITATRAHLFSLVDGDNYEWLIQSDTSLLPWATTNLSAERGGWEHVRHLAEISDFRDDIPQNTKFGGVWKSVRRSSRVREETSYLFLAEDGRVGILRTFRP